MKQITAILLLLFAAFVSFLLLLEASLISEPFKSTRDLYLYFYVYFKKFLIVLFCARALALVICSITLLPFIFVGVETFSFLRGGGGGLK